MFIKLKFEFHECNIYIPDGYLDNLENLQKDFLQWMYEQPECYIPTKKNKIVYSYNEYNFIKYLNTVLLKYSHEKAYLCSKQQIKTKKTLFF